jgi:plasmid replication initiation protein
MKKQLLPIHSIPENSREDQTLAKANEAIAIRPKRGKLTLLSRRIYNALLYHAQKQGVDEPSYTLPLAELIGDARFNSNNTELLKSHLRDMQATTIEWSTSSAGQKKWVSTQLIGTVIIEEPGRGKTCTITWHYPKEIRESLVKPNQYTKVLLEISGQMRSYSASVLYELGARYLTSPARLTMREDVFWWASVLTGRSDITEVDYRFLKRDVISKAIVEVETLCEDFTLELIEHKRGRKVEELQFRVLPKSQQSLGGMHDLAKNVFDLEIVGRLIAIGIKQNDAQDVYATTDEGQVRAALDHTEQRMRSTTLPKLEAPAAYFRDALKKGYAKAPKNEPAKTDSTKFAGPPKLSSENRLQQVRDAWEHDQRTRAKEMFNEMNVQQQDAVRSKFEEEDLPNLASPIVRAWNRDGVNSRICAGSFFKWLAKDTWNEETTDQMLIEYALAKGVMKFDS